METNDGGDLFRQGELTSIYIKVGGEKRVGK
jgi:hypothetical protein